MHKTRHKTGKRTSITAVLAKPSNALLLLGSLSLSASAWAQTEPSSQNISGSNSKQTPNTSQANSVGKATHQNAGAKLPITSETLATASDQQLTLLAANWGKLAPSQRRLLLAEMRGRMAKNQKQGQKPRQHFGQLFSRGNADSTRRQYGKVIREVRKTRQPDGSILVETRVLRVRPRTEQDAVALNQDAGEGRSAVNPNESMGSDEQVSTSSSQRSGDARGSQGNTVASHTSRHSAPDQAAASGQTKAPTIRFPGPRVTFGIGFERRKQGADNAAASEPEHVLHQPSPR